MPPERKFHYQTGQGHYHVFTTQVRLVGATLLGHWPLALRQS